MTTIKINDTYRVEIHNYDFVLIKHGKKHDITLGYFPKISMANFGKAIDCIEKYFDERG